MCKNLNKNCIEYIATISEDINGLVEFLHYDRIRCIYLYYDDVSMNILNIKNPDHNNSKLNITDDFCDFCPYKQISSFSLPNFLPYGGLHIIIPGLFFNLSFKKSLFMSSI